LFETIQKLDHPPFRKTSQLGEYLHFDLAPAQVGHLRDGRREQLDQRTIQFGLSRRHGSQHELEGNLRHAISTFPILVPSAARPHGIPGVLLLNSELFKEIWYFYIQ
jgi:hypothetical protein